MATYDMTTGWGDGRGCGATDRRLMTECAVAGVSYHVAPDSGIWSRLEPGMALALIRERDNGHDYNAVAVAVGEGSDGSTGEPDGLTVVGYLPRTENYFVASMIDLGWEHLLEAEVSEIRRSGPLNERLRLAVFLRSRALAEALPVRPMLVLRLDSGEYGRMTDELRRCGFAVFFRTSLGEDVDMVEAGDEIVAVRRGQGRAAVFMLRVFAAGDDCHGLMETAEVEEDDMFVVTCVAGPLLVGDKELRGTGLAEGDEWVESGAVAVDGDVARRFRDVIGRRVDRWEEIAGETEGREEGTPAIEEVVDWLESGTLRFYYRDVDTEEEWSVGDMLCPDFDVEVSDRFLKPVTNTRFVVATAFAREQYQTDEAETPEAGAKVGQWRLATIDTSSQMIVADIYQPAGSGTRQILLVHLPKRAAKLDSAELLKALGNVKGPTLFIYDLVTAARQDFDSKSRTAPLPRQYDEELVALMRRPLRQSSTI